MTKHPIKILISSAALLVVIICYQLKSKTDLDFVSVKRTNLDGIEILRWSSNDFMEAALKGKLVIEGGCIKIITYLPTGVSQSKTVVWQPHFKIEIRDESLVVIQSGKIVGQEGRYMRIGGGEVSDISNLTLGSQHLYTNTSYWLTGARASLLK